MGHLDSDALLAGPVSWRGGFTHQVGCDVSPMHRHAEAELVFHALGAGHDLDAAGERAEFAAGDATLFAPGVEHRQVNRRRGEDCCVLVTLPPGAIRGLVAVAGPLEPTVVAELRHLARPHQPDAPMQRLLDLRTQAALVALLGEHRLAADRTARPLMDAAQAAWQHLADHPDDDRRLERLARDLAVGYDPLRRAFHRRFGCSLQRWRLEARVRMAQHLLAHSEGDLTAIATACGFTHARHLCAVFRRHCGRSPGSWRAQSRSGPA